MRVPRRWRPPLVYALAAVASTWPLAAHPWQRLASVQGPGDTYLNLWIVGWDLGTLATHPAALFTGQIFNANIFFPAAGTLTYSDHFLLQALAVLPLYLGTHSLALCYNVLFVGSLVASAWAMHGVVRALVGDGLPAWLAGLAWGFGPYHFGHFIHLQLQSTYALPLAMWCLERTLAGGRRRDAVLLGIAAAGQALASVYYGVIGGVGLAAAGAGWLVAGARDRTPGAARRLATNLVLAAGVGALLVAPVALQYLRVRWSEGFGRTPVEVRQGSATLTAYFTAPPDNLLYGRTGLLRPSPTNDDRKPTEQMLFPGFVLMGLATMGLWQARRPSVRPLAVSLALVGLTGVVLSLGPDGLGPIYDAAYRAIFGFEAIRAPARFGVLVLFALAGLGAIGLQAVARLRPRAAPALLALVALEYVNAPLPLAAAPDVETPAGAWLRAAPDPGAVMYAPLDVSGVDTTPVMVRSLAHRRPIVNGYSGLQPAYYEGLAQTMTRFPSLETIKVLDDLHVRFVVTTAPIATTGLPLIERARCADGAIYEIRWTPDASAALAAGEAARATVPGAGGAGATPADPPFRPGETVVYDVVWTTGPLALPAGRATFQVAAGPPGRWRFSVSATTASWVSHFFEADDRFVSTVDDRLESLQFDERVHEGSKRADRTAVFDRAAGTVRLTAGTAPSVVMPAGPDVIDPVAAWYALRAQSLRADQTVRFSVDEWGRRMTVAATAGTAETLVTDIGQVDTWRLTPTIEQADGQSPRGRLTLWITRDSRRLPVRVLVDGVAGAGSVRLDLASYQPGS